MEAKKREAQQSRSRATPSPTALGIDEALVKSTTKGAELFIRDHKAGARRGKKPGPGSLDTLNLQNTNSELKGKRI